jgi:putative redox protein
MLVDVENRASVDTVDVQFTAGEAYEIQVRGHRVAVDQPVADGGADTAPTPTELFVGALAACVAYYAGRYLSRHGYARDGLAMSAAYDLATDRPARVAAIRITLRAPADLPMERWAALRAVAGHCTLHNSLVNAPDVTLDVV